MGACASAAKSPRESPFATRRYLAEQTTGRGSGRFYHRAPSGVGGRIQPDLVRDACHLLGDLERYKIHRSSASLRESSLSVEQSVVPITDVEYPQFVARLHKIHSSTDTVDSRLSTTLPSPVGSEYFREFDSPPSCDTASFRTCSAIADTPDACSEVSESARIIVHSQQDPISLEESSEQVTLETDSSSTRLKSSYSTVNTAISPKPEESSLEINAEHARPSDLQVRPNCQQTGEVTVPQNSHLHLDSDPSSVATASVLLSEHGLNRRQTKEVELETKQFSSSEAELQRPNEGKFDANLALPKSVDTVSYSTTSHNTSTAISDCEPTVSFPSKSSCAYIQPGKQQINPNKRSSKDSGFRDLNNPPVDDLSQFCAQSGIFTISSGEFVERKTEGCEHSKDGQYHLVEEKVAPVETSPAASQPRSTIRSNNHTSRTGTSSSQISGQLARGTGGAYSGDDTQLEVCDLPLTEPIRIHLRELTIEWTTIDKAKAGQSNLKTGPEAVKSDGELEPEVTGRSPANTALDTVSVRSSESVTQQSDTSKSSSTTDILPPHHRTSPKVVEASCKPSSDSVSPTDNSPEETQEQVFVKQAETSFSGQPETQTSSDTLVAEICEFVSETTIQSTKSVPFDIPTGPQVKQPLESDRCLDSSDVAVTDKHFGPQLEQPVQTDGFVDSSVIVVTDKPVISQGELPLNSESFVDSFLFADRSVGTEVEESIETDSFVDSPSITDTNRPVSPQIQLSLKTGSSVILKTDKPGSPQAQLPRESDEFVDSFVIVETDKPVRPQAQLPQETDELVDNSAIVGIDIALSPQVEPSLVTDRSIDSCLIADKPVDTEVEQPLETDRFVDSPIITDTNKPVSPKAQSPLETDEFVESFVIVESDKPVSPQAQLPLETDGFVDNFPIADRPVGAEVETRLETDRFVDCPVVTDTHKPTSPQAQLSKETDSSVIVETDNLISPQVEQPLETDVVDDSSFTADNDKSISSQVKQPVEIDRLVDSPVIINTDKPVSPQIEQSVESNRCVVNSVIVETEKPQLDQLVESDEFVDSFVIVETDKPVSPHLERPVESDGLVDNCVNVETDKLVSSQVEQPLESIIVDKEVVIATSPSPVNTQYSKVEGVPEVACTGRNVTGTEVVTADGTRQEAPAQGLTESENIRSNTTASVMSSGTSVIGSLPAGDKMYQGDIWSIVASSKDDTLTAEMKSLIGDCSTTQDPVSHREKETTTDSNKPDKSGKEIGVTRCSDQKHGDIEGHLVAKPVIPAIMDISDEMRHLLGEFNIQTEAPSIVRETQPKPKQEEAPPASARAAKAKTGLLSGSTIVHLDDDVTKEMTHLLDAYRKHRILKPEEEKEAEQQNETVEEKAEAEQVEEEDALLTAEKTLEANKQAVQKVIEELDNQKILLSDMESTMGEYERYKQKRKARLARLRGEVPPTEAPPSETNTTETLDVVTTSPADAPQQAEKEVAAEPEQKQPQPQQKPNPQKQTQNQRKQKKQQQQKQKKQQQKQAKAQNKQGTQQQQQQQQQQQTQMPSCEVDGKIEEPEQRVQVVDSSADQKLKQSDPLPVRSEETSVLSEQSKSLKDGNRDAKDQEKMLRSENEKQVQLDTKQNDTEVASVSTISSSRVMDSTDVTEPHPNSSTPNEEQSIECEVVPDTDSVAHAPLPHTSDDNPGAANPESCGNKDSDVKEPSKVEPNIVKTDINDPVATKKNKNRKSEKTVKTSSSVPDIPSEIVPSQTASTNTPKVSATLEDLATGCGPKENKGKVSKQTEKVTAQPSESHEHLQTDTGSPDKFNSEPDNGHISQPSTHSGVDDISSKTENMFAEVQQLEDEEKERKAKEQAGSQPVGLDACYKKLVGLQGNMARMQQMMSSLNTMMMATNDALNDVTQEVMRHLSSST